MEWCALDDSEDGPDRRWGQRPDPSHDQALLRALAQINERTWRELGPSPAGGLPIIAKRKPHLPRPVVPMTVPASTSPEEDTTMQWTTVAAVAALATGSALTACGAEGTTARVEPTTIADAPATALVVPMPAVEAVPPTAEAAEAKPAEPTNEKAPEPVRGPAIPAVQLRRQILALAGSFQSLEDLERENVERAFAIRVPKNLKAGEDFYFYKADTIEGWTYWIDISRLYGNDKPSTTYIYLDNGAKTEADPPAHCTLEFELLAKELVAMGYERGQRARFAGGDWVWGFGRESVKQNAGFGIGVSIFDFTHSDGRKQVCIKGLRIGGGPRGS
jgi:hypothetical protein